MKKIFYLLFFEVTILCSPAALWGQSCNFMIVTNGVTLTCDTTSRLLSAVQNPIDADSTYSYLWTRPNGTTSADSEIIANTAGVYTLKIIGTGISNNMNMCMDDLSVQIFSNQPEPTISITVNGGVVCAGGSSTLTAVANLPVISYQWERRIGNGNWTDVSGGATLPTGTLTQTTCYRVTVTTLCGMATSAEACVTVMPTFAIGTPDGVTLTCTTNALTLIAVPNSPNPNLNYTYLWTRPNGTTNTVSEITATAGGTYTLVVTGTGGGITCMSIPQPVQISTNQTPPSVVITPPSPVGLCPGDSIILTASFGPPYEWSTGATTQSITVNQPGTYDVMATGANGCTGFAAATVTTISQPTVSISGNGVVCTGGRDTLMAVANIAVMSYQWERRVGAGSWTNISGAATLFTGPLTETTCYRVRINTACGMAISAEACVTVVTQPNPVIVGPAVVCRRQQVIYSLQGDPATIRSSTITWSVTGNGNGPPIQLSPLSGGASVVRWGNTPEIFTVTAIQTLETCTDTARFTVTVSTMEVTTQPAPIIYYQLNNILISKDPDADCYQWGFYDPFSNALMEIPGETYQAYAAGDAYDANRRYWVKTWKGDCSSEPDCATISYLMQLPEETDTPRAAILGLYPNPNEGNFFLKAEGLPATQYALAVTDALGRSVLHRTLTTPNGRLEEWIQLPFAPNGLYHALLRDEQGRLFRAIPFILLK